MSDLTPNTRPPAGWYLGGMRWWDGWRWTDHTRSAAENAMVPVDVRMVQPPQLQVMHRVLHTGVQPANGFAIAALVLGIWGFLTTWIPLFIGLFIGEIPDILAIIFAIIGIQRAQRLGGTGLAPAVVGLVFGSLAALSMFLGAGTFW